MKMKFFTYLICFAVVGQFGAVAQANAIFDDFAQEALPSFPLSQSINSFGGPMSTPPQGIGPLTSPTMSPLGEFVSDGTRTLTAVGSNVSANSSGNSLLQFAVFIPGAAGFEVLWNAFPAPLDFLSSTSFLLTGVNWTGSSNLALELVFDDGTNTSSIQADATPTGSSVEFLFSDFVGTANLGAITGITLGTLTDTNGAASNSLTIDAVVVTPEPSGLILAGLAIIALFGVSYFRKQQAVAVEA